MRQLDYHTARRAVTGVPDECGDIGIIIDQKDDCTFALVDALGHGSQAAEIADKAEQFIKENSDSSLGDILNGLHRHLQGTRGAVVTICRLHKPGGLLEYAGIGNISLKIYGPRPRTLLSRDGIVGYMMSTPIEKTEQIFDKDIIVLSSDGIQTHFDPVYYPAMFSGKARQIAEQIFHNLVKSNDDSSCIVLKYAT